MSDTVFILGAGASAQAGAPLMADFLDVASDLRNGPGLSNAEQKDFDLVFKARSLLQQAHSKAQLDIHNLESVFAAFEMAQLTGRLGDIDEHDLSELSAAMQRVIGTTLDRSVRYPVASGKRPEILAPRPYDHFVELLERFGTTGKGARRASVITFNYDLCLDFACWRRDLWVDYCLPDGAGKQGVRVLKLHGSLNWARCECGRVWPVPLHELLGSEGELHMKLMAYILSGEPARMPITEWMSADRACPECGKSGRGPMIVPPTYSKAQHHQQLRPVWRAAAAELTTAENILVAGYSLPEGDHFFRYLYALGTTSDTILRRFRVSDPVLSLGDQGGEALRRRFLELLGEQAKERFRPSRDNFEGMINYLSSQGPAAELSLGPPIPE